MTAAAGDTAQPGRSAAAVGTSRTTVVKVLRSSAASNVVAALVGLAILPRIVHGLDLRRYGEWATLAALLAIGQLVQSGAGVEISRRVAIAIGDDDLRSARQATRDGATVTGCMALVLVVLTAVAAHPVVRLIFAGVPRGEQGQLADILLAIVSIFAVGLVVGAMASALTGLQRSDYATWSNTLGLVGSAGATLLGLSLGFGLWALVLASAVQTSTASLGPLIGVRRLLPGVGLRPSRPSVAMLVAFVGLPAMVVMATASDLFDSQVDKLVLAHNVGPAASAMFQIGAGLVQSMRAVVLIPLGVLLAGTAELHRREPERLRRLEWLADTSVQSLAALVVGGVVIFAEPFMRLWLGHGFGEAALSLRLLALAALLNAWSAPWTYYALGRGRYHYVLISAAVTLVVNLLCTVLLTSTIGIDGALIGSLAGAGAGGSAGLVMLRRWERRRWLAAALRASATVCARRRPGPAHRSDAHLLARSRRWGCRLPRCGRRPPGRHWGDAAAGRAARGATTPCLPSFSHTVRSRSEGRCPRGAAEPCSLTNAVHPVLARPL